MPAIFINPSNEEHEKLLQRLDIQNQDLRVFVSDKLPTDFIEKLPGKKAIGNIEDDSHISTASEGAYCGIYFEDSNAQLRKIFLESILNSSLKRIIWISTIEPSEEILQISKRFRFQVIHLPPSVNPLPLSPLPLLLLHLILLF